MAMTIRARLLPIIAGGDAWQWLAILFAALPLAAGLTFRTYVHEVDPLWFEVVRQLDLFCLLIELMVIVIARRNGFSYQTFFYTLPKDIRWAVAVFLTTFWFSSVFVTNFTPYSMIRAVLWPAHLIFGASLYYLGRQTDDRSVRRTVLVLLVGYTAYLPLLAGHFVNAPDPMSLQEQSIIWTSALPGYLSVRHFGIEMGTLLALILGLVWSNSEVRRPSAIWYFAIMLVGGAVCWSGTRSAAFGVAGAMATTIVIRRNVPPYWAVIWGIVALSIGAVLSSFLLPPDPSFGFRMVPSASGADYSSGRLQIWNDAFRLFIARPLTGWGEGSSLWLIDYNGTSFAHPHNMPLQMLESWGLPAAFAAFYLIVRMWLELQRRGAQHKWLLPILMAFDALLIMSMVDGVFFHARLVMMVAFLNAVALGTKRMKVPDAMRRVRPDPCLIGQADPPRPI